MINPALNIIFCYTRNRFSDGNKQRVICSRFETLYEFPDELIRNVKIFKSASTEALEAKIEELKSSLVTIKEPLDSDKSWKEEFKNGLSQNNEQILKLGRVPTI